MLHEKVALVTGASRGIGRAIALALAKDGARVVVHYHSGRENAEEVMDEIQRSGGYAVVRQADTGSLSDLRNLVDGIVKTEGGIDILVNNAGICPFRDFFDITEYIWDRTFNVNLKGYFFLTQYVARHMVDRGIKGRIVNVSSISGLIGSGTQVHYCSTKGGINMLTRASAVALAPYGITVNAVLPGTVRTDANVEQLADEATSQAILAHTPLQAFGKTDHIAETVRYFVSDNSDWTTGTLMVVDGGYTA